MLREAKDSLLKLNLQMFADDVDSVDNPDVIEQEGLDKGDEATYTQADVDRSISKAVENALKKREAKFEEEKRMAIEKAKREAVEYSKLTEKERFEKELADREAEIVKREEELRLRTLKAEVQTDLLKENLPESLAEVLVMLGDAESIRDVVRDLKTTMDEGIKIGIKERLSQDTPKDSFGSVRSRKRESASIAEIARKNRIIKE